MLDATDLMRIRDIVKEEIALSKEPVEEKTDANPPKEKTNKKEVK